MIETESKLVGLLACIFLATTAVFWIVHLIDRSARK